MNVFIRSAHERELPSVQLLLSRAWHATYDHIYGSEKVDERHSDWYSQANLSTNLAKPWSEFLVADTGAALLGMTYARQNSEEFVAINKLYVDPDYVRKGIGSQLLNECFVAFPEAKAFRLEVDEHNLTAIRFFERSGFKEISRVSDLWHQGSNIYAVVMERRVNGFV